MTFTTHPSFASLRPLLDEAVAAPDVTTIAHQVKDALQSTLRCDGLALPASFCQARPDSYARRLLHRDAKVLSTDYEGDDILVSAVVPAAISGRLESFAAASA